ncbi:MAG: 16S rRNA (cytosine(967)-C(5))-methyltransferase RsmB [Lachnospiraceae bacterium]
MEQPRELAFQILYRVAEEGEYSHLVLTRVLREAGGLEKRDRAFITRLCEGTLERLITVDYMLNHFSKTKTEKMKPVIRTILRMSAYQMFYMDSVPDSAVCNEAVKLAKKKGFSGLSGFVNGVLRNMARSRTKIESESFFPDKNTEPVRYFSIRYSLPEWLCEYFVTAYGTELAEKIAAGCLRNPETTIRVNETKISAETLRKRLCAQNITVKEGAYVPGAMSLSEYDSLESLPEFREGMFQVQDESSMLVAYTAGLKKGDTVVDVCAAPGGKALHAAQLLENLGGGTVRARDLSAGKTALIEENKARHGTKNLTVEVWDALRPDESLYETADVVIADLPCSGIGIMAKKPEIRYRMTKEAQTELADLQRRILAVVQRYVKPGGILMYSTCTINKEENEKNAAYLAREFGFRIESLAERLPEPLKNEVSEDGTLQLLPGVHDCDGFFIARLTKCKPDTCDVGRN